MTGRTCPCLQILFLLSWLVKITACQTSTGTMIRATTCDKTNPAPWKKQVTSPRQWLPPTVYSI